MTVYCHYTVIEINGKINIKCQQWHTQGLLAFECKQVQTVIIKWGASDKKKSSLPSSALILSTLYNSLACVSCNLAKRWLTLASSKVAHKTWQEQSIKSNGTCTYMYTTLILWYFESHLFYAVHSFSKWLKEQVSNNRARSIGSGNTCTCMGTAVKWRVLSPWRSLHSLLKQCTHWYQCLRRAQR